MYTFSERVKSIETNVCSTAVYTCIKGSRKCVLLNSIQFIVINTIFTVVYIHTYSIDSRVESVVWKTKHHPYDKIKHRILQFVRAFSDITGMHYLLFSIIIINPALRSNIKLNKFLTFITNNRRMWLLRNPIAFPRALLFPRSGVEIQRTTIYLLTRGTVVRRHRLHVPYPNTFVSVKLIYV